MRGDYLSAKKAYIRLLGYTARYRKIFAIAILGMIVTAAMSAALSLIVKPMMNDVLIASDKKATVWVPLILILIGILRALASFATSYSMSYIGFNVVKKIRDQILAKYLNLPVSYYDRATSGELVAKITYNVTELTAAATTVVTMLIRDGLTVIGLLFTMFYLSAKLAAIFLLLGPITVILIIATNRGVRRYSYKIQDQMGRVAHVAEEVVEGHKTVKVFGGEHAERERFAKENHNNISHQIKLSALKNGSAVVIESLAACMLALIIYMAANQILGQPVDPGTFMAFFVAVMSMSGPLKRLTKVNAQLQVGIAAAQSVFQVLDETEEDSRGTYTPKSIQTTRIEFKDVTFQYPHTTKPVFENISFCIEDNKTVALVGYSGSGKTSLANLLTRFYEPTAGTILLNGKPISEYSLSSLRSHISFVGQGITLFNDTVYNNIAYGELANKSREDVIAAAHAAYAYDFIMSMPQGFNSMVGENGVLLSGGQRQRIAIARALLKGAPLLILDEATSALDSESEQYIQRTLRSLLKHCTTFVIAHRLSTIENADQIIVMDKGKIVETGTHRELLEKEGVYSGLYHLQFATQS